MELLSHAWGWVVSNKASLLAAAVAIDSLLAEIPAVQSNSLFQLLTSWLRKS